MDSKDLIKAGRLQDARKQLIDEVKASPGDLGRRTLLFQVMTFCGEWDKAAKQLDAIAAQDAKRETGVQVYKNLIHAEKDREDVSRSKRRPPCLPKSPPYLETHFAACTELAAGKLAEAEELFDQAESMRPAIEGTINGKLFSGFRDTDTVLSPFLEAIVHDQYVWVPFESIRELTLSTPSTLFDLIWLPSNITTWDGLALNCYVPIVYPESSSKEDDRIKLGRMTDWLPLGGHFTKAAGQHVYQIGDIDMSILEIRDVRFTIHDSTA